MKRLAPWMEPVMITLLAMLAMALARESVP
jgi:hypothetical protein